MALTLNSPAFREGEKIPAKHSCEGDNISPPLRWQDPPAGTQSFALIVDDPDAPVGTWVHWVLYDLPGETRELAEQIPSSETLANGARQGLNDFRKVGYGGPCPPPGPVHRYFFKLYALSSKLNLAPKATKADLEKAMQGKVLGQAQWMGRYNR